MRLRRIKVFAVLVPAAGLAAYEAVRHFVLQPLTGERGPHFNEHIVSGVVLLVAVLAFSFTIFRLLERLHGQLVAVGEAAIAVTADLSVDRVLERVAELARSVAGVPYASVRVEGGAGRTVASGERPPEGSTLVVPIVVRGAELGELVLVGAEERQLRQADRGALETFARQAGIALENARLFEQVQELVASRERVRIGMDLHDGVIQELYALGLKVEDAGSLASTDPDAVTRSLREVQGVLRGVIGEIRAYVYDLRGEDGSVDLQPALERLAAEFPSGTPVIELAVAADARIPAATAANVLHIVREALANALRHAGASSVLVWTAREDGAVLVSVEDDGRGFDPDADSVGLGIGDMRERAAWCRCGIEIRSTPGSGTAVRVSIPEEREQARVAG